MKKLLLCLIAYAQIGFADLKLESVPRLDTATALKILVAAQEESLKQKVDVSQWACVSSFS